MSCESWCLYALLTEETVILSVLAPDPIRLQRTITHAAMMIFVFGLQYIVQIELNFLVIYLLFLSYFRKVKYAGKPSVVQNFFAGYIYLISILQKI